MSQIVMEGVKKSKVIIAHSREVNVEFLQRALAELGLLEKLELADVIAIKPNLTAGTYYKGGSGVVTRSQLLEVTITTINACNDKCKVYIMESDDTCAKFEYQGYGKLKEKYGNLELLDLPKDTERRVNIKNRRFFEIINLSEKLLNSNFFISCAIMKTHPLTTISGILKNQLGCLSEPEKRRYHPFLPKVLCDINRAIKPDLCIMDGSPGLEGHGPIHGKPKDIGLVLFGNDPVATDSVSAYLMGFNPSRISHMRLANESGLGEIDLDKICVEGGNLSELRENFELSPWRKWAMIHIGLLIQRIGYHLFEFGHGIYARRG